MAEETRKALPPPQDPPRRKAWIFGYIFIALLIAVAIFIYWWGWLRFEEYTDDAYVAGNMVALTPQIPGIVVSINADETDIVEKGQLVIELDPTDFAVAYEGKKAELADALRKSVSLFERVGELGAEIEQRKALLWKSALDYEHRKNLVEIGGVSIEDFEHSEADLRAAYAALIDVEHALTGALAQVDRTTVVTHPSVEKVQEELKEAYIQLNRCKIYAPVRGMIAQRRAQVGERVLPAEKMLAIVPLDEMWVYANFKEVQLKKVKIGQPVKMTADIYGSSVEYHGRVIGLSAGTGSVFSIIPPQNATGNWIKIVQRLPVRITLDAQQLCDYPLRLGLSMEVTVDIHDTQGSSTPPTKSPQPVYETDIFEEQLVGIDEVIDEIIHENVSPVFLNAAYYENFSGIDE
ncbi:MAG: efflux RND transporter periplasmic adaptor subunit [Chlamydiales bacterium]|nr:efflux RND transporter periplasmic adaptor subunit [Chlamydiales bacterium]